MKLFLDSSVLLAASGSEFGASREIFRCAKSNSWNLLATPYVSAEVNSNLQNLPASATAVWKQLQIQLITVDDVLTLDRIAVFEPAKDRPILFSALAWAEVLLTLDRADFGDLISRTFYGLSILTPGMFLEQEKIAGRLNPNLNMP